MSFTETSHLLPKKDEKLQSNVLRLVLIGDSSVGKSSLVQAYLNGALPDRQYQKTIYEHYEANILHRKKAVMLMITDNGGDSQATETRYLSYSNSDIVLICFSIDSRTSFTNVRDKWIPEVRSKNANVPLFIIATKSDLKNQWPAANTGGPNDEDPERIRTISGSSEEPCDRTPLSSRVSRSIQHCGGNYNSTELAFIDESRVRHMVTETGAKGYLFTSAACNQNVKETFTQAVSIVANLQKSKKKRVCPCCPCL